MALTPYIWALWQTKTGKVIISCILIYFIGGVIIKLLRWWTIPAVLLFAGLIWLGIYLDNRKRAKVIEKSEKEFARLREIEACTKKCNKRIDKQANWFHLVIGKTGNRPEEFSNNLFTIKFVITDDFYGLRVNIRNKSDKDIDVKWESFTINNSKVHINGTVYVNYDKGGLLRPDENTYKILQPHKLYFGGKFTPLFNPKEMMKKEVRYDLSFDVIDNEGIRRTYVFNLYTINGLRNLKGL